MYVTIVFVCIYMRNKYVKTKEGENKNGYGRRIPNGAQIPITKCNLRAKVSSNICRGHQSCQSKHI